MSLEGEDLLEILQTAPFDLEGEFVWGSNYTFLVRIQTEAESLLGVYKPAQGEQPLWDFPHHTLAHREVAAFIVSHALGWDLVPPTAYREDGPFGEGSLQIFIEHDPDYHYFTLKEEDRPLLRSVALFDCLVNNADRKGGHIIFDQNHHMWLIDHGICFHVEDKLRTVVWDFAGEPIPHRLLADLEAFRARLDEDPSLLAPLREHLSGEEIEALKARADYLMAHKHYPLPPTDRRSFPYPPL